MQHLKSNFQEELKKRYANEPCSKKKGIRIKQKSERNTSTLFLIVIEYMHDFLFELKASACLPLFLH